MALSAAYWNSRNKKAVVVDNPSVAGVDPQAPFEYFEATATITALLAGTAVPFILSNGASTPLDAAYVGTGRTLTITGFRIAVSGATAWSGGTGTKVEIQDTSNTVVFTALSAALTASTVIATQVANTTPGAALLTGNGAITAARGLILKGDNNYGAGSDIKVFVCGTIK